MTDSLHPRFQPTADMQPHRTQLHLHSVAAYLVCIALVPIYVNMFPLWKYLNVRFGEYLFIYLPAAVTIILAAGIVCFVRVRQQKRNIELFRGAIAAGLLLCIVGLIIPDPAFPVKRIHVAEYLLLALIARFAMAPFMKGVPLLFFSSCFAAILGIHDEFLQGIHPARTYGLRDMTVNALASFGGGLIGHGLSLFTPDQKSARDRIGDGQAGYEGLYVRWLLVSVVMLVVPAVFFRGMNIETWTFVPLIGSIVFFSLYRPRFRDELKHGIAALNGAAWSLAGYPCIIRMDFFVFY